MNLDFSTISTLAKYKILSNAITPRPIAWVSSVNAQGVINLAPFSFFAPISSDPVVFSLCLSLKSDGELKDTLKNALSEKKATICMCESKNLKAMHLSSKELEFSQSEAVEFDIKMQSITPEYPPVPEGTQVAFFCEFFDLLEIGKSTKTLLLEAKGIFISDEIYNEELNFRLHNVGRVGKEYQISQQCIDPKIL